MKSKILVIDDEIEILNVYERILMPEDDLDISNLDFLDEEQELSVDIDLFEQEYEVIKAANGKEGVEQARLHPDVKVAFIDMRMPPGINGAETAKQIREINPNVEIVIATAYSDINLKEIVNIVGKPEKLLYLRKPFASEEIEQLALNLVTKFNSERIKERFLSNVSHEMKTPLSVVSGYASILEDEIKDEEQLEYLSAITKSSKLLEDLVNSLLVLTEINTSKSGDKVEKVKLSTVFEFVQKQTFMLQRRYPEVVYNSIIKSDDVFVSGKGQDLVYAIGNIIDNAFKFTKKGSVDVDVIQEKGFVSILVKDTGVGIPEEKIKYVYDKFYRVEDLVHTEVGFGLGLGNTKELVQRVGGSIKLSSKENLGTSVKILIPIVEE